MLKNIMDVIRTRSRIEHKLGKWIAESRMSENSHAVDTRITRIGLQDAAWIDSTD
jgi:hypothetical protein|tara:strand:+ start:4651 stop:4815 length:165 start_codon:yes stop_codon:yes gene_type:complete